jgi:hypothetical protein
VVGESKESIAVFVKVESFFFKVGVNRVLLSMNQREKNFFRNVSRRRTDDDNATIYKRSIDVRLSV